MENWKTIFLIMYLDLDMHLFHFIFTNYLANLEIKELLCNWLNPSTQNGFNVDLSNNKKKLVIQFNIYLSHLTEHFDCAIKFIELIKKVFIAIDNLFELKKFLIYCGQDGAG